MRSLLCLAFLAFVTPALAQAQVALAFPVQRTEPLRDGNNLFTGLAVANPTSGDAQLTFKLLGSDGTLLAPAKTELLKANQQLAFLCDQFFGLNAAQATRGWISLESATRGVVGFFLVGDSKSTILDGADVSYRPLIQQIFPEIREGGGAFAEIHLANPSDTVRNVSLQVIGSNGEPLSAAISREIAPNGNLSARLNELFPGLSGAQNGYVKATCHNGTVGFELFGNNQVLAGLNSLDPGSRARVLYSAQLATGGPFFTQLTLVNASSQVATVTLIAYGPADPSQEATGVWVPHPRAAQNQVTRSLGPGQKLSASVADLFGFPASESEITVGWIQVESSVAGVVGNVTFGDPQGTFLASVPLSGESIRDLVFSQVADGLGFFTGVTILNPSATQAANVILEVFKNDGTRQGAANIRLGPRTRRARLLREFFTDDGKNLEPQVGGFIRLRSDNGILAFELFGNDLLRFLSAVPPQVIELDSATPPPAPDPY
ncbi:MAG: hypothetical protein HY652_10615 [Acidobacteria bacterium]|nr:hypothetical protein [Acidobacteriota bacterium]